MNRRHFLKLVLPLGITIVGCALLRIYAIQDDGGILVNLMTELVGIIITVGYVDWVLKEHEKKQWSDVDERIIERLRIFVNRSITNIRVSLDINMDFILILENDRILMHKECLRISKEIIEPYAGHKINNFDPKKWHRLAHVLQQIANNAEEIISLFGHKLTAKRYTLLLDVQELAQNAITMFLTFPDIAGVPDDDLAEIKKIEIKHLINESAVKDIRKLLETIRIFADTL